MQVLRVCCQLNDEASSMIDESLFCAHLKLEGCDELQPHGMFDGPETPKQDAFLSRHGHNIKTVGLTNMTNALSMSRNYCADALA